MSKARKALALFAITLAVRFLDLAIRLDPELDDLEIQLGPDE